MESDTLKKHILKTYCALRVGLTGLAVALPVIVVFDGLRLGVPLLPSLSDYYFAAGPAFEVRTWFVGILFAAGALLVAYRGYNRTEDLVLDLAGICAVMVALFPTSAPDGCTGCGASPFSKLHIAAAAALFLCVAFVAVTCSQETLARLPKSWKRWRYRVAYDFIAAFMTVVPVLYGFVAQKYNWSASWLLIAEWMAIYGFAAYWGLKTRELCFDSEGKRLDEMATSGRMPHANVRADGTADESGDWRLRLGRALG